MDAHANNRARNGLHQDMDHSTKRLSADNNISARAN